MKLKKLNFKQKGVHMSLLNLFEGYRGKSTAKTRISYEFIKQRVEEWMLCRNGKEGFPIFGHLCYCDISVFSVQKPSASAKQNNFSFSFTLSRKDDGEEYNKKLEEFLNNGKTIGRHPEFQRGLPIMGEDGIYDLGYLFEEVVHRKIPTIRNPVERFSSKSIDLKVVDTQETVDNLDIKYKDSGLKVEKVFHEYIEECCKGFSDLSGRPIKYVIGIPICKPPYKADPRNNVCWAAIFIGLSSLEDKGKIGDVVRQMVLDIKNLFSSEIIPEFITSDELQGTRDRQRFIANEFAKTGNLNSLYKIFLDAFEYETILRGFKENICFFDFNIKVNEEAKRVVIVPGTKVVPNDASEEQKKYHWFDQESTPKPGFSDSLYLTRLSSFIGNKQTIGGCTKFLKGLIDYDAAILMKQQPNVRYIHQEVVAENNSGGEAVPTDCLVAHPLEGGVDLQNEEVSRKPNVDDIEKNQEIFIDQVAKGICDMIGRPCSYYIAVPFMEHDRNVAQLFVGLSDSYFKDSEREERELFLGAVNDIVAILRGFIITEESSRKDERDKLKEAYTKAAIGSIMSRNGSHNIGSHVLSALSHNVGTMPDDRILYQYIQHRMDYIASATTGAPDWSVPTPFVGSVMKMFYSQRHLLDHIAESDGLRAYQYQGKGLKIGNGQKNCVKIVVRKTIHPNEYGVGAPLTDYGWDAVHQEYAEDTKRDVYVYDFFPDKPKGLIDWSNDESLAIPGGVLGQHAFYNIVENILRNAAKHSWAGKDKKARENTENLEIYIDFEKWKTDGTMCFTVGDNMSVLFPGKFWQAFFDEYPEMPFKFSKPLDGFVVPPDGQAKDGTYHSNRISLEQFLNGERDTSEVKLPSHYVELYKYIVSNWDQGSVLRDDKEFLSLLTGTDTNDPMNPNKKLGRRLPLPLHHRQEIVLSQPFIDVETNRLRQTAWGLSEMKISAGYLRRSDVSVIGGLKNEPGRHPLIVPMGIPHIITKDIDQHGKGGCTSDEVLSKWISKKLCYKDLCLAYRFWIKLPKEVLFVTDDALAIDWKTKVKEWAGIDVMSYSSVFGEGGKNGNIGKMSDYGFVIVDHPVEASDSLKSPFRTLWISNADVPMSTMPYVLRSKLKNAGTRQELVECVYQAWLNYLKFKRGVRDENKDLTIRLKMSEKKDGEKGLVSDRDIYKVLFRECLHSVLEPLADKQIKDLDVPERQALLLLSLYPIDETDEMFGTKNVEEQFKAEGDYPIATRKLLGEVADRVRSILSAEPDAPNRPSRDRVLHAWRRGLENPGKEHLESIISPLLKFIQDDTSSTPVPNGIIDVLSGMKECSRPSRVLSASHSSALDLSAQTLETARATSEVFLRKYEERITTLPRQYRGIGLPEKETLPFSGFGVSVCYNETSVKADISYLRHSTDDAALYSEPLSGAQNYLNALSNLSHNDAQWAMRLAENGLLRIAVIDERVYKFISDHGEEIRKTYASMHIAVVDTEKKPCYTPEDAEFPDLSKLDFAVRNEMDADFDLVVVHQGIIDKWWPNNHGKENVAKILNSLRNPGGGAGIAFPQRFVVVTTGRGRPDNIPDTEKVLAFSSIEACLFKRYPEKLNLVNSLMGILPGSPGRNNDNG